MKMNQYLNCLLFVLIFVRKMEKGCNLKHVKWNVNLIYILKFFQVKLSCNHILQVRNTTVSYFNDFFFNYFSNLDYQLHNTCFNNIDVNGRKKTYKNIYHCIITNVKITYTLSCYRVMILLSIYCPLPS